MTTLRGHFDGKVIVPDEPVDLPKDVPLDIHVTVPDGSQGGRLEELAELAEDLELPEDLAEQHDHYLYGTPKR